MNTCKPQNITSNNFCGIARIICFKTALSNPTHINSFEPGTILISWSVDGVCFTNPVVYDIHEYRTIISNLETDVYLRIYTNNSLVPLNTIDINGITYTSSEDYTIVIDSQFGMKPTWNSSCVDMYANLDCALLLQQQLADNVICMLGIPVYYFRCEPREDSKDLVFKEYTMHDVVDCKQIKLMLSDGQLPSSNHKLTELDFDWEIDWEVEVSKTQFATAFGDKVFPKYRDFIYVPMMKRMWLVNSAYDERADQLMWASNTFKLTLVKYTDSSEIKMDEDFTSLVDKFVEIYNPIEQETPTLEKNSAYSQVKMPSIKPDTNVGVNVAKTDAIRYSIDTEVIQIKDEIICHNSNIVGRNCYRFIKETLPENLDRPVLKYKNLAGGFSGSDFSIIIFLDLPNSIDPSKEYTIISNGTPEFTLSLNQGKIGNHLIQCDIESGYIYCIHYQIDKTKNHTINLHIYQQLYPTDRPAYTIRPEQKYFSKVTGKSVGYNEDIEYALQSGDKSFCLYPLPKDSLIRKVSIYNESLLGQEEELFKYTTKHSGMLLNDLCRPLTLNNIGFNIR